MKKITFLLFILSITVSSQTATYPVTKEGKYKTYISRDSLVFNVGDKLEIDLPYNVDRYMFISQGQVPAGTAITGATVEIKKLISIGDDKKGYKMWAQFKGYGLLPVDIDIENALRVNEIILLNN